MNELLLVLCRKTDCNFALRLAAASLTCERSHPRRGPHGCAAYGDAR